MPVLCWLATAALSPEPPVDDVPQPQAPSAKIPMDNAVKITSNPFFMSFSSVSGGGIMPSIYYNAEYPY
jgi:hypothetical protein